MGLDVLTMAIALFFNLIKYMIILLEMRGEPLNGKNILFTIFDLLVSLSNLLINISLSLVTIMTTKIVPIYLIASVIQSSYAVISLLLHLWSSLTMVSKLKALPELTLE